MLMVMMLLCLHEFRATTAVGSWGPKGDGGAGDGGGGNDDDDGSGNIGLV